MIVIAVTKIGRPLPVIWFMQTPQITFNFLFWIDQYSQLFDENFQYYV